MMLGNPMGGRDDDGPMAKRGRGLGDGMMPLASGLLGGLGGGGGGMSMNRATKVIQVRNLPDQVMEADLIDTCSQFGNINYVNLTGRGNALVEFETRESAEQCVQYNSNQDLFVCNQTAFVSYAPVDEIPRRGLECSRSSAVLVMQVQNPKYPITTDVVSAICKPIAAPTRIIITRRQGIQVLAEFTDAETARNLKQRLNGCDIYSGCCTLKIEYAKLARLNVTKNDQDTWDYIGPGGSNNQNRPSLLSDPSGGFGGSGGDELGYDDFGRPIYDDLGGLPSMDRGGGGGGFGDRGGGFMDRGGGGDMGMGRMGGGGFGSGGFGDSGGGFGGGGGPMGGMHGDHQQGGIADGSGFGKENGVMMVYGMTEKFNCDKLFNICCLYGNVVRVKFMKSKEDSAMVQMGDCVAAERTIRYLNRLTLFGKQIQLTPSKKPFLEEMRQEPFSLPDGTPSYRDYTDSRSNRFLNAEAAARNRINGPSTVLYFFNAPPELQEEQLNELFEKLEVPKFVSCKIFDAREGSRSKAGLLNFESDSDAAEVLATANHAPVDSEASRTPYLLKFCFGGSGLGEYGGGGMDGGGRGGGRGRGGGDRGGRGDFRGRGSFRGGPRGGFNDSSNGESRINGPQHLVEGKISRGRGRGDFRGGRGGGDFRGGRGGRGEFRGRGRGRGGN